MPIATDESTDETPFASITALYPGISVDSMKSFQEYLKGSSRILALCGAGLSASSGLPTFRGAGGMWRTHEAMDLATPQAFNRDPGLVWQFYSYRRHMALQVKPNKAHFALAELSKKIPGFVTLSQNVDGILISTTKNGSASQIANAICYRSVTTGWSSGRQTPSSPWLPLRCQMQHILLQTF
jgi:hypothetical protein